MKVVFRTYTKKDGSPEYGVYAVLQHMEGLKEKDILVRIDVDRKNQLGYDEVDIFCPSLKISHLELKQLDKSKFEATFDTKNLRAVFQVLLTIGVTANPGHSFEMYIGNKCFSIDGDGADYIESINDVQVTGKLYDDRYQWAKVYNKGTVNDPEFKELQELNESALDVEYHFTSLRNFFSILRSNKINVSGCESTDRGGRNYLSLSRIRNSKEGYGKTLSTDSDFLVRLELDGRKLNQVRNVNIKPYDYFAKYKDGNDPDDEEFAQRYLEEMDSRVADEMEDSLTLPKGQTTIDNAISLINRVDILLPEHLKDPKLMENFADFTIWTNSPWNAKIHYFLDRKAFDYQIDEKQISGVKVMQYYSEQIKRYNLDRAVSEGKIKMSTLRKLVLESLREIEKP